MELIYELTEITEAARQFIQLTAGRRVFAFHGDMGAGKTTFIEEVCRVLKVDSPLSSPTFSIINEYVTETGELVYHLDLYRLKSEREALDAGVEDCIYSGFYCFVEWPERAPGLFNDQIVNCELTISGNNRRTIRIKL